MEFQSQAVKEGRAWQRLYFRKRSKDRKILTCGDRFLKMLTKKITCENFLGQRDGRSLRKRKREKMRRVPAPHPRYLAKKRKKKKEKKEKKKKKKTQVSKNPLESGKKGRIGSRDSKNHGENLW
jgi:hypothetical protein